MVSFLSDAQCINWTATWSRFKNCSPLLPKSHTSFKKSAYKSFTSKLLLDELPLLHKLQTSRRPDLYKADWNCFLCHNEKETWEHLWQCPVLKPRLVSLCDCTKVAFETWIVEESKHPNITFTDRWNYLDIWKYPDLSCHGFTFDMLIKGLIPKDLTDELTRYLSKKDTTDAINVLVSKAIDIFHDDVWQYRCQLFAEYEASLGINQSSKASRSTSSSDRTSSYSSFRRLNASPNRWMTWISESLKFRKPWSDFPIYINSLNL